MSTYEFLLMLDGAYPNVPFAGKRKSNFIDLSTEHYDSVLGQHALEDQLELAIGAERLGFDGVVLSEQHNGPIGLLGNPMLAGAYIAARTQRIRIGVVGPILNAYATPLRFAEELTSLDIMTRGRLIMGLPMGHGMQHHSIGVMNPARVRARFREAHDLLMKALTEPGPFEWQGDFFHIPYVNLWPKPMQTPHPPIFVPGGGSVETLQLVAKHRYTYLAVLTPRAQLVKTMDRFRELCRAEGYEADPKQIAVNVGVHVAETDKQARQETEAYDLWQYQNFFQSPMHDNFPPGYVSSQSLRGMLGGGYRSKSMNELSFDELVANGWVVAGSPETVAAQLKELADELGAGRILVQMQTGAKPTWLASKSMSMFAEEVIPRLRPGGEPTWKRAETPAYETLSEYGARKPVPTQPPMATLGDGLVDVQTAHVEALRTVIEPWPPTDA